jgi:hypothetical protein
VGRTSEFQDAAGVANHEVEGGVAICAGHRKDLQFRRSGSQGQGHDIVNAGVCVDDDAGGVFHRIFLSTPGGGRHAGLTYDRKTWGNGQEIA